MSMIFISLWMRSSTFFESSMNSSSNYHHHSCKGLLKNDRDEKKIFPCHRFYYFRLWCEIFISSFFTNFFYIPHHLLFDEACKCHLVFEMIINLDLFFNPKLYYVHYIDTRESGTKEIQKKKNKRQSSI